MFQVQQAAGTCARDDDDDEVEARSPTDDHVARSPVDEHVARSPVDDHVARSPEPREASVLSRSTDDHPQRRSDDVEDLVARV